MAKVICFLLAVLCGLASINVSFAEPSTMYGAAPAKYPAPAAPATYHAAPAKYETPAPPAPPAPAKYETPAPPAPAKYEAEKPKYEEMKKEEYPMKMEYKTEEKPVEYKKKEEYPSMKMPEYGGKKYRRSIIDDEEEVQSDPFRRITPPFFNAVRDAVIMKLLSESDDASYFNPSSFTVTNDPKRPPIMKGIINIDNYRDAKVVFSSGLPLFTVVNDEKKGGIINIKNYRDAEEVFSSGLPLFTVVNDPKRLSPNIQKGIINIDNYRDERMGWSKKQARRMRDAIMVAAENDPRFGKTFGKEFAKEAAGGVGSFIGSKIRGGDPFSVTVQDLVEMYGRDPVRGGRGGGKGKFAGQLAGSLAGGVLGGLADDMDIPCCI